MSESKLELVVVEKECACGNEGGCSEPKAEGSGCCSDTKDSSKTCC